MRMATAIPPSGALSPAGTLGVGPWVDEVEIIGPLGPIVFDAIEKAALFRLAADTQVRRRIAHEEVE